MFLDRLVRWLLPRQDLFFTLLEDIAAKMTATAAVFAELATASGHAQFRALSARLKVLESETDQICHRVYHELDRTFVTPIDREDLALLTKALDNVVDGMEDTAAFAALFRFDALTEPMCHLIRITAQAAPELAKAVGCLRHFSNPDAILELTVRVHTLENEADVAYRNAVEALFANGIDARELVRQKDMLDTLENGVDYCEDAMDVIRSVVVKNG